MFEDYVIPTRQRSAEDVLAVFIASHQTFLDGNPKWPYRVQPAMEMTLEDWFEAAWIDFPNQLRKPYNELFRVNLSRTQWRAATHPAQRKTLGDLCRAISDSGSAMDVIEPVSVLGRPCRTAGAFAFVVTKLRQASLGSLEVTPSTPLAPVANAARETFEELATLQPKLLPLMRRSGDDAWPLLIGTAGVIALSLSVTIAICRLLPHAMDVAMIFISLCSFLLFGKAAAWLSEKLIRVQFEGLETVGDLCRLLAASDGDAGENVR